MWGAREGVLIFFACVATLQPSQGELFTAISHLQSAVYAERDIAGALKQYIQAEELRLEKLRRLADDMEEHSVMVQNDPERHIGNPVNAFLFVKRFTLDWDRDVEVVLRNNSWEVLTQTIAQLRQDLPTYEDLSGTAAALMRLQDTYQLDTEKLAQGDINGIASSKLTAEECFQVGRFAYIQRDFYHTTLWMQAAMEREKESVVPLEDRVEIRDYLSYALAMQGDLQRALSLTDELLLLEPDHERAKNNKMYFEKMIADEDNSVKRGDDGEANVRNVKIERQLDSYRNSEEFFAYEKLCRGEEIMPNPDKHKLKCRYWTNNNPSLLLSPIKMEEVHLKPWIVMFHEVMTDNEIAVIKRLATPKLNRATVQNSKTGQLETADYRISKSAWLTGDEHPVVKRVNSRIQAITGLDMATAEELQVANYGIGGHYEPHFDFARKEETEAFKSLGTGNRIATFLFYMTDVQAGGATVFPYIGVKLWPRKGAAAFWYNLFKSGEGIYDTRHAACPVLVGMKWVSNKWIHERGQEFRRPCGHLESE